jgi:hypothetical protein
MSLDAMSRHLFTAGKLRFPTVFPKLGTIEILPSDFTLRSDRDGGEMRVPILRLTENCSHGWSIVREVLVANVAAVFIPCDPEKFDGSEGWECRGDWMTGEEAAILLADDDDCGDGGSGNGNCDDGGGHGGGGGEKGECDKPAAHKKSKPCGRLGLLFLDEHVSVLNHISYGSSAADSVDIVPHDDFGPCCNPVPCCPSKR